MKRTTFCEDLFSPPSRRRAMTGLYTVAFLSAAFLAANAAYLF